MPQFLAQLPEGHVLRDVLMIAFAFLGVVGTMVSIALGVRNLLKKDTPFPQPVKTEKSPEYVSMREHQQLRADHQALAAQVQHVSTTLTNRIEEVKDDLMTAGEARAVKIHERLNTLIETAFETRGRLEAIQSAGFERNHEGPGSLKQKRG